jgi:hypothetical protein
MFTAPDGSTTFSRGAALGAQIIDGGAVVPAHPPAAVPEPATLISAGSALLALGFFGRRKQKARGTTL